jgi:anti-sigma regulatory factor (Ser/Thr protein kinase)
VRRGPAGGPHARAGRRRDGRLDPPERPEGDPKAVSRARRLTTEQLRVRGLEGLVDAATLVVSELVTNAVRYSGGAIGIRLIRNRTLTCEVTDDSSTSPHLRRALDIDEGGRGLFITAQLAERWEVRSGQRSKTIWAELDTAV